MLLLAWAVLLVVILTWGVPSLHAGVLFFSFVGVHPVSAVLLGVGIYTTVRNTRDRLPRFRSVLLVVLSSLCLIWQSMTLAYELTKKPVFRWYKTVSSSKK